MAEAASLVPLDDLDTRFRGLVLPVDKKPGGYFHVSFTREIIKSSIMMILMTRPGERVMLPEFGSQISTMAFEPNDIFLEKMVQRFVEDDLGKWEPRIRVVGTRVTQLGDGHTVQIEIVYEILSLSVEDSTTLVFRREGTGETATGLGA